LVSSADKGGGATGQKLCHLWSKDGTKLTVLRKKIKKGLKNINYKRRYIRNNSLAFLIWLFQN
jgi:hypothetical protein